MTGKGFPENKESVSRTVRREKGSLWRGRRERLYRAVCVSSRGKNKLCLSHTALEWAQKKKPPPKTKKTVSTMPYPSILRKKYKKALKGKRRRKIQGGSVGTCRGRTIA